MIMTVQVPVYKMGQLFCYDWLAGHSKAEDFTLFNFDDIDVAFEKVQQVKYSQTVIVPHCSAILILFHLGPPEGRQRTAVHSILRWAHDRRRNLEDHQDGRRGDRLRR